MFHAAGNCWFAHAQNDLRCRLFALNGVCPYGVLCGRLHVSNIPHDPHSIQYKARGSYASSVAYARQLWSYPLPHVYSKLVPRDNIDSIRQYRQAAVTSLRKVALQLPLIQNITSRSNIAIRLYNLQYIEQVFNIIDIMQYRLYGVTIKVHKSDKFRERMFDINVPGLSENRPSLLRGDEIHVMNTSPGKRVWCSGSIYFTNIDSSRTALPHLVVRAQQ